MHPPSPNFLITNFLQMIFTGKLTSGLWDAYLQVRFGNFLLYFFFIHHIIFTICTNIITVRFFIHKCLIVQMAFEVWIENVFVVFFNLCLFLFYELSVYVEMTTGEPLFPGDSDIDQLFLIAQCLGKRSCHVVRMNNRLNTYVITWSRLLYVNFKQINTTNTYNIHAYRYKTFATKVSRYRCKRR